jgi:hypothetical protein
MSTTISKKKMYYQIQQEKKTSYHCNAVNSQSIIIQECKTYTHMLNLRSIRLSPIMKPTHSSCHNEMTRLPMKWTFN